MNTQQAEWVEVPWEFHIESTSKSDVEGMIKLREEKNAEFLRTHPDFKGHIETYALTYDPVTMMYSNITVWPKKP